MDKDMGASANAETGSHRSDEAPVGLRPSGFDPARIMREALEEIRDLKERPFRDFPTDWQEQIANCDECQGWAKNHPIQRGICDEHRRPIWAQERHDAHERSCLGIRASWIARDALYAASVDRSPEGQDAEERLDRNDESAVAKPDAPKVQP